MKWTKGEEDFLRKNYKKMSDEELALAINRSEKAVLQRRYLLNLTNAKRNKGSYRRWSKEEDDYIRKNYKKMNDEEIGRKINRTRTSVWNRRVKTLKLKNSTPKTRLTRAVTEKREGNLEKREGNLPSLLKKKEKLIERSKELQGEKRRFQNEIHFANCRCKACREQLELDCQLAELNVKIRRARGIPQGGCR